MKRTKRFFINGLILGFTTILMRGVGVGLNAYITGKIGAEGIGLFGLVMSVYMFAATLASSGASLAATRLVTEELSVGCHRGIRRSMKICLGYTVLFGFLSGSLLFIFAEPLGIRFMGDPRTVRSLKFLSVSMPCIAVSSGLGGYFTAVRRVAKSSAAQILELLVKVLVTVLLLAKFCHRGVEFACAAVVAGGTIAEIASCIFAYVLYRHDLKRYGRSNPCEGRYLRRLLQIAAPVAVSAYLRSGLVTVEHMMVPRGLKQFGASASASLAQYGVVHGMAMPLLLFPMAVLSAFAGLLVPELTEFQKQNKTRDINRVASRALSLSLVFGIGTACVFFAFGHELGMIIYKSGDAGLFLRFLAPLVIVMYADHVTDFMLKGLNQQVYSMGYNIIDSTVSILLIAFLLPRFGIDGYIAVVFITEILNTFLSVSRLIRVTDFRIPLMKKIFMPVGFGLLSTLGLRRGLLSLLGAIPESGFALGGIIALSVGIYLGLLALFSRD